MRRAAFAMAMAMAMGALALAACGGGGGRGGAPAEERLEPPPEALSKDTVSGPVTARVQLWPTAPQLGDAIHLRLTVEAKPGVNAEAPFEHEALGRFSVIGWNHDTERRDDGTVVEVQTYTLEAPGSGKFRVPPLRIEFGPPGAPADAPPSELLTEEIPITVATVDPARAAQELAPPAGALKTTVTTNYTYAGLIAGVLLLALVVAGIFLVRALLAQRDRQEKVSAYDEAVRRLEALERYGAPDPTGADAWFVELSSVVRRYLEGRYGVRAPELTTEEFLQETRRAAGLPEPQRELLTAFLERCDRVKFAGYRPDADESMATLKAARAFVEETRLRTPGPGEAA
jgi:hypothetical protein